MTETPGNGAPEYYLRCLNTDEVKNGAKPKLVIVKVTPLPLDGEPKQCPTSPQLENQREQPKQSTTTWQTLTLENDSPLEESERQADTSCKSDSSLGQQNTCETIHKSKPLQSPETKYPPKTATKSSPRSEKQAQIVRLRSKHVELPVSSRSEISNHEKCQSNTNSKRQETSPCDTLKNNRGINKTIVTTTIPDIPKTVSHSYKTKAYLKAANEYQIPKAVARQDKRNNFSLPTCKGERNCKKSPTVICKKVTGEIQPSSSASQRSEATGSNSCKNGIVLDQNKGQSPSGEIVPLSDVREIPNPGPIETETLESNSSPNVAVECPLSTQITRTEVPQKKHSRPSNSHEAVVTPEKVLPDLSLKCNEKSNATLNKLNRSSVILPKSLRFRTKPRKCKAEYHSSKLTTRRRKLNNYKAIRKIMKLDKTGKRVGKGRSIRKTVEQPDIPEAVLVDQSNIPEDPHDVSTDQSDFGMPNEETNLLEETANVKEDASSVNVPSSSKGVQINVKKRKHVQRNQNNSNDHRKKNKISRNNTRNNDEHATSESDSRPYNTRVHREVASNKSEEQSKNVTEKSKTVSKPKKLSSEPTKNLEPVQSSKRIRKSRRTSKARTVENPIDSPQTKGVKSSSKTQTVNFSNRRSDEERRKIKLAKTLKAPAPVEVIREGVFKGMPFRFRVVTGVNKALVVPRCPYCNIVIPRKEDMNKHLKSAHFFKCTRCKVVFPTKVESITHRIKAHALRQHECIACDRIFSTLTYYNVHCRSPRHQLNMKLQERTIKLVLHYCLGISLDGSSSPSEKVHREQQHTELLKSLSSEDVLRVTHQVPLLKEAKKAIQHLQDSNNLNTPSVDEVLEEIIEPGKSKGNEKSKLVTSVHSIPCISKDILLHNVDVMPTDRVEMNQASDILQAAEEFKNSNLPKDVYQPQGFVDLNISKSVTQRRNGSDQTKERNVALVQPIMRPKNDSDYSRTYWTNSSNTNGWPKCDETDLPMLNAPNVAVKFSPPKRRSVLLSPEHQKSGHFFDHENLSTNSFLPREVQSATGKTTTSVSTLGGQPSYFETMLSQNTTSSTYTPSILGEAIHTLAISSTLNTPSCSRSSSPSYSLMHAMANSPQIRNSNFVALVSESSSELYDNEFNDMWNEYSYNRPQ